MPAPTNMADVSQFMGRFAPADRPRPQPLCRISPHAKWVVTSDDEHAVSMLTLGPCKQIKTITQTPTITALEMAF